MDMRYLQFRMEVMTIMNCSLSEYGMLDASDWNLEDRVVKTTLANGLTVLVMERHNIPAVY